MSEENKQRYEEAKEQRRRVREVRYKKVDEQLKVIADMKRYIFAALLAVVVGLFSADNRLPFTIGVAVSIILLVAFVVLIVIRYQKIEKYDE